MLPSIFSSGVTQINILVGTIIASFESGAVSYLYYADRVYQINLAIAGIAVGTVSLPVLSKAFHSKNYSKISNIQNKSIQLSLLFSMPASLGLIIASEQIINGLFGYGSFTLRDVEMTSIALKFFGYGVIAFAFVKNFGKFFFARNNTKTPFYISSFMVFLNIIISLSFFCSDRIFNYSYCNLYFNMDRSFDLFLFIGKNNYLFLEKKNYLSIFLK